MTEEDIKSVIALVICTLVGFGVGAYLGFIVGMFQTKEKKK